MRMTPAYTARLAASDEDREAVFRLRYEVFVAEMGGDGPLVDHDARLERDRFDPFCHHLMLLDPTRGTTVADQIIGTYRMMDQRGAEGAGAFYTEGEYDLAPLLASGRRLMECGRSCLSADVRGGLALQALWQALARHVMAEGIEVLFGVASFHGREPQRHRAALSLLHHEHLAPPELRSTARKPLFAPDALLNPDEIDRLAVMREMPALIKAYLRLGGFVGQGAFVDHAFNTCDVCMILDVARVPDAARARLLP